MVRFRARLPASLDQAMTLFTLRRLRATGEFVVAPGASDMEMVGEVADEKLDDLVNALVAYKGAIHAGERHISMNDGITECTSVEEAEAHMGGPYTMPGASRAVWAYGSDVRDHIIQLLYTSEDRLGMRVIVETTERPAQHIMKAMQSLIEDGTIRKFRKPGDTSPTGEEFGLARTTKDHIARLIKPFAPPEDKPVDTLQPDEST
jgi:hypothetical protein